MKSKVYFTRTISPESVVNIFNALQKTLPGKVAIKVHSGEIGNQNFLKPEFWAPLINLVNGTVVECNTAYEGKRNTTEKHIQTMKAHGWSEMFPIDIMDSEGPDTELSIKKGKCINKNYVGKNLKNDDSLLVL